MNPGTTSTPRLRGPRTCLAPIDAPPPLAPPRTARLAVLLYGVLCYALTLAAFAYSAGFLGNFLTPTRLDAPATGRLAPALAIDLLLLALFGLQHSVMARPWFKRWWTRA